MLAYYAGIILNASPFRLCSNLCWHNGYRPSQYYSDNEIVPAELIYNIYRKDRADGCGGVMTASCF